MQRHPMHPPPAFFLKVASSHCHIASKNITKKKHKKKTTMTEKKQHMQRHPMHLGGRRCALPPNPPPAIFFKGCLLSLPHCFQEHHEEKTQEEDKNDRKKTTHAKTPNASGGEALCPPHKKWHPKENTNANTPNASFEEHYRKKQQMQKHPMHLGGRRLSLTHHEENKREQEKIQKKRGFPAGFFLF